MRILDNKREWKKREPLRCQGQKSCFSQTPMRCTVARRRRMKDAPRFAKLRISASENAPASCGDKVSCNLSQSDEDVQRILKTARGFARCDSALLSATAAATDCPDLRVQYRGSGHR